MESLIMVAEKCERLCGTVPYAKRNPDSKTIPMHCYDLLTEFPYQFTHKELMHHVHVVIRNKPENKLNTYDVRRNELCKNWGWGIHVNMQGKLGIFGCETNEYKKMVNDNSVRKIKSLNPN